MTCDTSLVLFKRLGVRLKTQCAASQSESSLRRMEPWLPRNGIPILKLKMQMCSHKVSNSRSQKDMEKRVKARREAAGIT